MGRGESSVGSFSAPKRYISVLSVDGALGDGVELKAPYWQIRQGCRFIVLLIEVGIAYHCANKRCESA